ncbi:N-formylglutamate amidohydrolase [Tropicimonas marinistellae]|uniref:N-formylglutamate amidohydrolase n=1 Tax=Tropicimonas marinistellae TaxID=1739787 RepID=UPI0008343E25|nr:N-formylglutamate amidohydrolase [Tropicimonas marinistellae]
MKESTESALFAEAEGPIVEVLNPSGVGGIVLACEHASNFIPVSLQNLGLSAEARSSHAAWDIGALDLAKTLMHAFDAPLVSSRVSRLVYDCNRPPEAPDAVPARSERFDIPGNRDLSEAALAARVREVYTPFRTALAKTLAARSKPVVLVTVHSFTPVFNGQARTVELGLLHDSDARMAAAMLAEARRTSALNAALNEPYSAADGVTHSLREHAVPAGLPNVMIEVRNDLIRTADGVQRVGADLVAMLHHAMDEFPELAAETARESEQGAG